MRTCRLEHAKLAKFRFNCNGMLLLCLCCKPSHYLLPVHKICCSSLSNVVTFSGRRLLLHKILIPNLYSGCNTFCSRCLGGYIFPPKAAAQGNSWIPPFSFGHVTHMQWCHSKNFQASSHSSSWIEDILPKSIPFDVCCLWWQGWIVQGTLFRYAVALGHPNFEAIPDFYEDLQPTSWSIGWCVKDLADLWIASQSVTTSRPP